MARKNLQVLCVQETKWRGSKAREIGGGYKLYYHGEDGTKNEMGIVLCEELKDRVLAVERPSDRVRRMKVKFGTSSVVMNSKPDARNMKRVNSGKPLIVRCKL